MRTSLVLRVPCAEVASMVAQEGHDRVVLHPQLRERFEDRAEGLIDAGDTPVVIRQLLLPVARKKPEIPRNKRVGIAFCVTFGRYKAIAVVLEMGFKLRNDKQEGLASKVAQEANDALGEEVHAVDPGEMNRLAVRVVDVALVRVRGVFERVRALPEVQEPAAKFGGHRASQLAFFLGVLRQMPFADVVRGVTRLAERGGERHSIWGESQSVSPNAILVLVLPGEQVSPRGCAERLVSDMRTKQCSPARHSIKIRCQAHRVESVSA